MEFQIARDDLLQTLQSVIGVVERRQTMPILSHLLLQADNGVLTLTSTDLELELRAQAPIELNESGTTTVPARKLFDICRGLPQDSQLVFKSKEGQLTVQSGRSRFTLSTLSAGDFPFLEQISEGHHIHIPKANLKRLLERTHFAMAHQDVRYYLNGLLLAMRSDRLRAVATDGHRLALCDVFQPSEIDKEMQVIVPRKAVTELRRLLDDEDESVEITLTSNHLQLTLNSIRFTTKLIDGRFPDYERVIPDAGDKRLTGDRNTIHQALSRTAILSNEKFRGVRLQLEDNTLKLQAQNPEHEQAEEELEVEYEGSPLEIGFNVNYLLDALSVMDSEQFTLEMSGSDSSGLLKESGDQSSRYVVMPMRL